jgi:hypothetical protein
MTLTPGRIQTAANKAKALKQYEALRRANVVQRAVVIAELKDGSFHILGQELTPTEIAPLLLVASDALVQADANRKIVRLVAHVEPERRGVHNEQAPRRREIKTAADGTLIPPKGENFISCGECSHPTWYVLHYDEHDTQSRIACAHCGNEVKGIPALPPGHA